MAHGKKYKVRYIFLFALFIAFLLSLFSAAYLFIEGSLTLWINGENCREKCLIWKLSGGRDRHDGVSFTVCIFL